MSKLEQTSAEYDAYEAYVESERMDLRREGAEEMRIEIIRAIDAEMLKVWDSQQKFGLQVAKVLVEQAFI